MRRGKVSVGVEAPAQPSELRLGEADPYHPSVGKGIARRKPERLVDVSFGFFASAQNVLGKTDESMSDG